MCCAAEACWARNPEVGGSKPLGATNKMCGFCVLV